MSTLEDVEFSNQASGKITIQIVIRFEIKFQFPFLQKGCWKVDNII